MDPGNVKRGGPDLSVRFVVHKSCEEVLSCFEPGYRKMKAVRPGRENNQSHAVPESILQRRFIIREEISVPIQREAQALICSKHSRLRTFGKSLFRTSGYSRLLNDVLDDRRGKRLLVSAITSMACEGRP